MINIRDNYWAVEVPDNLLSPFFSTEQSINRMLSGESGEDELIISYTQRKCGSPLGKITFHLPPATWEIVCTSKEATEELLKEVIPELPVGQRWQNYGGDYPVWFHSRRESLRSLLASKGCDVNKNWLILKKQ
jgi:hypothetical protein